MVFLQPIIYRVNTRCIKNNFFSFKELKKPTPIGRFKTIDTKLYNKIASYIINI